MYGKAKKPRGIKLGLPRQELRIKTTLPPINDAFKTIAVFIPIRAGDAVKLSFKVSDKNGRENQTKTRWVWSGRHNENDIGYGKHK